SGNCNPSRVTFYCAPLSETTTIDVIYLDENGAELTRTATTVSTGDNYITPGEAPAGYSLVSSEAVYVSVDAYGNCNPGSVTFYCAPLSVTTSIDVIYLDENGAELSRTAASVSTGDNYITPGEAPAGYSLVSSEAVYVSVDAYGNCNPSFVAFYCAPLSVTTSVDVIYLDESGAELTRTAASVTTGDNYITPGEAPAGYSLVSAEPVYVSVDAYGTCSPAFVTFTCEKLFVTVSIDVIYVDENGAELYRTAASVSTGDNTITPDYTPEGYIVSADPVSVTVDGYGNCTPAAVTIPCERIIVTTNIDVVYVDHGTGAELSRTAASVTTGDNYITPGEAPEGYRFISSDPVYVLVDHEGFCAPASVTFYCTPLTASTNVPVVYLLQDSDAELHRSSVTVYTGDNYVSPVEVPAGYQAVSTESVHVAVDGYGACTPDTVVFYCIPASVTTQIDVIYLDENGAELARTEASVTTGDNYITPDTAPEGYSLAASKPVYVRVDGYGQCEPAQVIFSCVPAHVTVSIPVYYFDAEGALIAESAHSVATGANSVQADLTLVPGYLLISENPVAVTVDHFGACTPEAVSFYCALPAPEETPAPEVTAAPVIASVIVRYVNTADETIYSEQLTVQQGSNTVSPKEDILPDGYTLENDIPVTVTVDALGTVTPFEVVFRCLGGEPEATPAPVEVIVYYLDENDAPVASPTTVTCFTGINHVYPQPVDLRENYVLTGDEKQFVVVDETGAMPASVVFRYAYQPPVTPTPTAVPAPKIALVPVYYKLTNGEIFYTDNTYTCTEGENTVTPNPQYVPADYLPQGPQSVTVFVDENGVAAPGSVTFTYGVLEVTRDIVVYYRDKNGNDVASPQIKTCYVGLNLLSCEPFDLRAGYKLISMDTVQVTMDSFGTLMLGDQVITDGVTFLFEAPPTPTPPPTPIPYKVHAASGWCYPTKDTINFRSSPSTASGGNVLRTVTRKDLGRIDGYVINDANERWYMVTIGKQTGFLKDTVVRILTQEEINALFGYTPTPAPTPIPDGAVIDRWGYVNTASVNFRDSIGGERLYLLKKDSYVFVYQSETVKGETWYHARYGNSKGYEDGAIMAKYVTLLSPAESLKYQQSLPTPMPVRTPEPTPTVPPTATPIPATPAPTVAPSPVVTATAVPSPVITATPAPYTGYALTLRAVDLRTGVKPEDTTLSTLPAHTLVYLWGQAYIDGVCWHSAEALQLGISGYLPDSVLQRISAEDAAPYLSALQPQATPTPEPTRQPDPFSGYAVTNGNNVLLRAYANTSAEIIKVLPANEVVWVLAQEYTAGEMWQVVRYGQIYGYIRGDQLRMMSYEDSIMYEESLRTATPAPAPTPTVAPLTQESLSSYGYVTTNNVRLRSGAGTETEYIRMMNRYAFALVLGTEEVNGKTWYHINQAGAEGYVMGDYFKVLSLGELQHFLTSDEYLQSQDTPSGSGSGTLTSPEDFNQNIWQNPATGDVPTFNPSVFWTPVPTATVNVEAITTPSPTPTVSVLPTTNFEPYETPVPNAKGGSGNGILWLGLAAAGIVTAGGVYAYSIHRQNQRRAAQRAAQRRAAQQQAAHNAAYQRPQTQYPPQAQQTQQYRSAFTPPAPRTPAAPPSAANPEGDSSPVRRRRSDRHQG
ncbi:MAG: MucBP domain-containing protein, partial [Clostridia bacterium]|nr:MucBP domain-containing protein [Clostridia bacterium]